MMHRVKRSILPIMVIVTTIFTSFVIAASAQAYLHVANAQTYAKQHSWKTFCSSSSYWCPTYPNATGWYQRINNNYVRVEIHVWRRTSGHCYRVFAVKGEDWNMYISTDGSSAYWACQ